MQTLKVTLTWLVGKNSFRFFTISFVSKTERNCTNSAPKGCASGMQYDFVYGMPLLYNTYIWRLLNFGDISGKGKERQTICSPIFDF